MIIAAYFIVLNLIGFASMRRDKTLARRRARRTPENTLMFIAFAGGALGSWIGMYAFRHKTKHRGFTIGVPLLLAWNVFGFIWLMGWFPLLSYHENT
ncbi:DUF1294 domain-containing protein [Cohnella panacarvi]|uniref:DUF1294 domain-containing protein n=1 Tax=Cohnella panacarvi TaxID=400776 RepID=UPI00047E59CC|nr:DUF1294 domain-containing protein [Cohnella panacarvi]